MERPIRASEYCELESSMDYWIQSLIPKASAGVQSQFKDLFRNVYDQAYVAGRQSIGDEVIRFIEQNSKV